MSSGGFSNNEFKDDYNSNQSTLAYGKHINRYGKLIVMKTLIHVIANENKSNDKFRRLESAFKNLPNDVDEAWQQVLAAADVHSTEGLCMLAYEAIGADKGSLLYSLITTYAKISPLKSATEWFDNFRLTGIANSMNLLIWRDDVDGVYGVGRLPKPINQNIELDFKRVKQHLVRPLREFIIKQSLFPENIEDRYQELSDKEICDKCYEHFPFYFGGAHGCDVFTMSGSSLSISEIKAFCKRYPSAIVGYILNTETYRSGRGQHWLSIAFSDDSCSIINSAGRGLESFHDEGYLSKNVRERFAAINYNDKHLQNDGYSCGMFSVISLYMLICFDMNVSKAVEHIGVNGNQISSGRSIYDYTRALALNSNEFSGGSEEELLTASASPAINQYLLQELDTISGCSNSRFSSVKIPAINKQLQSYVKNAREAVEQEVYEELTSALKADLSERCIASARSDVASLTNVGFGSVSRKELLASDFSKLPNSHFESSRITLPSFDLNLDEYNLDTIKKSLSDVLKFNQRVLEYKQQLLKSLSITRLAAEYKRLPAYKRTQPLSEYAKQRLESLLHI